MASSSRDASPDTEAGEALLEKHSSSSDSEPPQSPLCPACAHRQTRIFGRRGLCVTYLNLVLFLTSVLLLVGARRSLHPPSPSGREALEATSSYSPVFDAVDLAPVSRAVDGRLHVPANASIFRAEPSNETDAAWDDVSAEAYEVVLVNATVLERAGFNPAHYFKAPSSWGHGEGQYPVQIDVFHQIHCLNAVRKQMYYQHYYAHEFPEGPDEVHWMHQRHCLHMVLQSLMCNANVDIVPHRWVERDNKPFAQFSIQRQCRNFDNLRTWNTENAVKNVRDSWPHDKKSMPPDAFVWPGFGESVSPS